MPIHKILCVDDSETDLKQMEQICSDAGYRVLTARSGEEALDVAMREQPDAILLDVILPDINGFEVCRQVTSRPETKAMPVILVSSKGERTDRIWGEEQGASGYVAKPYSPEQLLEQLRALG